MAEANFGDVVARLQARANSEQDSGSFPATWKPEQEGEELAGVLVKVETVQLRDGGMKPVATIRTAEGVERTVWLGTVLRKEFAEIAPGAVVLIRYLRERVSRNGRDYRAYKVLSEPAPAPAPAPTPQVAPAPVASPTAPPAPVAPSAAQPPAPPAPPADETNLPF